MHKLPETGFLRLHQIIGEPGITEEQARANKEYNEQARKQAIAENHLSNNGKPIYARKPTKPRSATTGLIPVSKSTWWAGVASGRYPQPVRTLGRRITLWRVEDLYALINKA